VMNSLVEAIRVPTLEEIQAFLSRTYHELPNDWAIWHGRFMHVNPKLCLKAKPDLKDWPKKAECDDCIRGKFHKHSHSGSRPAPKDLHFAAGEFLTCDLFGPLLTSAGGAKYVGFYVDLKSRFIYGKPLRDKTSNYQAFLEVMQDCRARSGKALRFFKTDGDGIFTGGEAQEIYANHFIRHIQSAPGDSASNDIAERTIRTIVKLTRTTPGPHPTSGPIAWLW
jgi:transposase InsO family protein